jgi:hypothetical protein
MRVMVIIKATEQSESGAMPSEELMNEMQSFNEKLVKAGIWIAGEGLHPSSNGKRLRVSKGVQTVIDGPFAETRELIAGFWLWKVNSIDEAFEWVKRIPNPMSGDYEVELRQVYEECPGSGATPEFLERERNLREQIASQS